jgi:hypothetical protein
MRNTIDRRRFLKGGVGSLAVAIALPRPASGAARPVRYVTWGFGNGVVPKTWIPQGTGGGSAWSLSSTLEPLAPWKAYLTVIGNVKVEGASQHGCGNTFFVTGTKATTKREPQAPSVDQLIAAETRKHTPLKSLELGIVNAPEDEEPGRMAWSHNGPGSSNHPTYDAGEVFDRLFGPNSPGAGLAAPAAPGAPRPPGAGEALRRARKSVLDFVLEDGKRLRAALPPGDRRRLDQHLEAVFALERRIATAESPAARASSACAAPPAARRLTGGSRLDAQSAEANAAMAKLLALAFACDLTRVATYQITQAGSIAQMPEAGVTSWHGLSHEPQHMDKIQKVVSRHVEYLAALVKTLHETPDGDGNLLDNLALLTVNDVSDGWNHSGLDMPVAIVGKAGGRLRGDVHVRPPADFASATCLTVARAVVNLPSFGLGPYARTEPVAGVLA